MKNNLYIIAVFGLLFLLSGCSGPQQTVSIVQQGQDDLAGICRLDHYSCSETAYFTPGMTLLQQLLKDYKYSTETPELAAIGVGCDIKMSKKVSAVAEGGQAWFIELQLEFYDLETGATARKTVLNGQVVKDEDVITLIGDMLQRYFLKFTTPPAVKVPVAIGQSRYDADGRSMLLQGRYQEALKCFQQAVDDKQQDHAAWYNFGLTCELLGETEKAVAYYTNAWNIGQKELYRMGLSRIGMAKIR